MKISIIIPVYNQRKYIADAIESAKFQSIKAHEIIVVDDGSTDNSEKVADSYNHPRAGGIKVIHQVNKGLASARNTGIMNATGEYILPLDADDIILENCLEKMIEKIKETNADIIAPSFKAYGVHNNQVILDDGLIAKSFASDNRIPYCSAVRRSALLEIGGYSPRMEKGYEDWHLWIDLLKRGKTIAVIKDILFLYRTKEVSMITEAQKHDVQLRAQIRKDHPEIYA